MKYRHMHHYQLLLTKIDRFIRRYYLNLLVKGVLLFGAGFLILFLAFTLLEYIGYFNSAIRLVLLGVFVVFNAYVFIRYVLFPFLGMLRIGRRIGPAEAARILGLHFRNELGDRITNTLQLKEYLDRDDVNAELILAGIDQKAKAASVVPFRNAVNFRGNLRFLPFLLIPLLFVAGFLLLQPALIIEPAQRIIRYDAYYEKPAPFSFVLESETSGFRNENLPVSLRASGSVVPSEAEIIYNGGHFALQTEKPGQFAHTFRNLQDDFRFFVESGGFRFGPFDITVLQKPGFSHFQIEIEFPAYTRLPSESYSNMGDITVAEGAMLHFEMNTQGSGTARFVAGDTEYEPEEVRPGVFSLRLTAGESFPYTVYAWNEQAGKGDSLSYYVQVRPDQYPRIQVESYQDSVLLAHLFHRGLIQDDYGFTRLEFRHRVTGRRNDPPGEDVEFQVKAIDIDRYLNNQPFYHHLDMPALGVSPGQTLEYFFVVFDNDGVNGPKSSRTQVFSHYVPSMEEQIARSREADERIREELSGGMGEVKEARDEIESLRRQMLESERLSWEQTEGVRDLLDKQQEMEEKLQRISEQKKDNEVLSEQFRETHERIQEKQEELQKIFDEVLSDEMKELFDKIREELDLLDRNQVYDLLQQMDFEFRDLETQMDRALELFRQLEMERMLQESIDMLEKVRQDQAELSDETKEGGDAEEIAEEQEALKDEFEQVGDMLQEFREKNEQLSRPQPVDDTGELEDSIREMLEQAMQELMEGDMQGAQEQQEGAGQGMDQLSQRLQGMQQNMFMEQLAEDVRVLREILENLLKSSFSQEELMLEIRNVNVNDPRYVDLVQQQRKIKEDLSMIEDSLIALSKRQVQIQGIVTREIGEIHMNLDQGIEQLSNRQRGVGMSRQQFVMTHINNLALLLNESLQNMRMQMQMSMGQGEGMPMPMPSFESLREMQEQMNEMLQQMQEGNDPMPGQQGEGRPMSESEAMARMAAEQEAIRRELQKLSEELLQQGVGDREALEELQRDMERNELDMLRKQIGRQTIMRQERIMTRLLEHEQAELEREMEERRVGNTAKSYDISNPESVFEYNRIRNRELEMLQSLPPGLKPFYRSLVESYFLNVQDN
jgi:putative component of toxin-antitoxin plasmid stabilization module